MTTSLRRVLFMALIGVASLPLVATFTSLDRHATELASDDNAGDTSTIHTPTRFVIEVTGRDFRWHFRYLDPDVVPTGETTSSNELRLPVGATVELHLTSDDYIYVFSVPELGIEQIAVPDLMTESLCMTREPVIFNLQADPLCSFRFYHDELMGRIIVHRQVRFTQRLESS
ncbi:MAG: hypothetical protein CMJ50_09400 [Planctomycetaceae bacterium]|nr:hypothetical protein [Planctomycetaceae bacterium]